MSSIQKKDKSNQLIKGSLNALKCRLTGFEMDEIIHEDLQVLGGLLTEEALLLACNC